MTPGEHDAFDALAGRLAALFAEGVERDWADRDFERMARDVFEFQFEHNAVYRSFCLGRGVDPASLPSWRHIPPVPTSAFKHLELLSGSPDTVERVFRTSGTTRGAAQRGRHPVRSLDLYRAAAMPNLRAHLVPEGEALPVVALLPPPDRVPSSSLSTMVGFLMDELGAGGSGWYADADTGVRHAPLRAALEGQAETGVPVLVVGTAFAFVHLLDDAMRDGWSVRLSGGSRVMETGGFKGRSRQVSRDELYGAIERTLGVPTSRVVNEYGMTELLSQFYEPVLLEPEAPRRHRPPPWVRTRLLDPVTLDEVAPDRPGLLCHLDLANVGSVSAVLTEDMGERVADGFRVLGRAPGAEPRGCSLSLDELLAAEGA